MAVIMKQLVIYNNGKTSVALTEADGPQFLGAELEARLVAEGVAIYVDEPIKQPKTVATDIRDNISSQKTESSISESVPIIENVIVPVKPEYNKDMKLSELREIMEMYQIPYKVGMSKGEIVAKLDEYFGVVEEEIIDDMPDLNAEEPVL